MARFYKRPKGYVSTEEFGWAAIEEGAAVYLNPYYYGENEQLKKYFVMECSSGTALIASNKRMLNNGEGHLYSIYDIAYYKNA